jgi:DHA1 family inner membrane transport protein
MNTDQSHAVSSSKAPQLSVVLLSCAYFIVGTASLAVVAVLDQMAVDLHSTKQEVAQLITAFALTFAIAAPTLQIAAARATQRTLLIAGLVLLIIGAGMTVLVDTFSSALAARLVMALGAAAIGPTASSLAAGLVPPDRQSRALAAVFWGMTLAMVVGVPLANWLGRHLGWRMVFGILAGAALAVTASIIFSLPKQPPASPAPLSRYWAVFAQAGTVWAIGITLCQMTAQFCTYALAVPFLNEYFGALPDDISLTLLLFGIGGVIGNGIAGKISDALGAARTTFVALLGLGVVFLIIVLAPGFAHAEKLLFFFWGLTGFLFQAPHQLRMVSLGPDLRQVLLAANASAIYIGMSLGTLVAAMSYSVGGVMALPMASVTFVGLGIISYRMSLTTARRCPENAADFLH